MTSEAASGGEEASRVDPSGLYHDDKGKGKETASTPGAHMSFACCSRLTSR